MTEYPTNSSSQQTQLSQSFGNTLLVAKRGQLALAIFVTIAGLLLLLLWWFLKPLPFRLITFSHPSQTTLLMSTRPSLIFTFSDPISNSNAIIIEPTGGATVTQHNTDIIISPTEEALNNGLLTITFPQILTDTKRRQLSQDHIFSYSVIDSLTISNISTNPLTVGEGWIVTFSHTVPDNTCPIKFKPNIQGVCSKISPFSYEFEPLWLGHEKYTYYIGFGDTPETSGTVVGILPTSPTLKIIDNHIILSLPTSVDSTVIQNNLRILSGNQPLNYTLTTNDNIIFRIKITNAIPGNPVSITLNDLPLGNDTIKGITQVIHNPSHILSLEQDKKGRGWHQKLCAVVKRDKNNENQQNSYECEQSQITCCLPDVIIDKSLYLTIDTNSVTKVILLADTKEIWKTTNIQSELIIPLEKDKLINASSITIRLMNESIIIEDLIIPLKQQKARIISLEVFDGRICLYTTHELRHGGTGFSVILSHNSHNVIIDERYKGFDIEEQEGSSVSLTHCYVPAQTFVWPNQPYTARISGSIVTDLGYPVDIPSKTFALISPGLDESQKKINWNYRNTTNTFPNHHDLHVRRTATNLDASYVYRCIKDYDPDYDGKEQYFQNADYEYRIQQKQKTPCSSIRINRIPSSGTQTPNRHKPILHHFTIPTSEWKHNPNPEIWIAVSYSENHDNIRLDRYRFIPTSLSAFLDITEKETLWFVTDRHGNSVNNLRIINGQTNQELPIRQKKPGIRSSPRLDNLWRDYYIITADEGKTIINYTNTMDTWELNLEETPHMTYDDIFVYIYTDRPLYKPNDEIFVKGIVRAYGDKGYTLLPKGTHGFIDLINHDGESIRGGEIVLDAISSFSLHIPLKNIPHGTYRWALSLSNHKGINEGITHVGPHTVLITDYVKPNFLVETQIPSKESVGHQTITLQGNARFYHGLPVANAPVNINLFRQEIDFLPKGYDEFSFGDANRYWYCRAWQGCANDPDFIPGFDIITTKTNAKGDFSHTLDLRKTYPYTGKIYLYGITASVTDPLNGEIVVGNSEVIIYPSTTFFGIKAPRWVEGNTLSFSALALDQNAKPKANTRITATIARTRWEYSQKQSLDGNRYYTQDIKTEKVATVELRTNAQGLATHMMKLPANGDERTIHLSDPTNPQTPTTTHHFWRSTNSDQTFSNTSVIELITDKKSYKAGETAKVWFRSPINTGAVLVLIQRDSDTLEQWIEPIKEFGHQINIPIKHSYSPNVYVKIVLIGTDPELNYPIWKRGASNLKIDSSDKRLTVTITTTNQRYEPKNTVNGTVTITTPDGKPVANADVSLAIVDMSLLALKGNPKKNPYAFFWDIARPLNTRSLWSVTNLLDSNILLKQSNGEKGGDGILGDVDPTRVRGNFRDTARRQAHAKTNAQGILTFTTPPLPDNLTERQIEAVVHTNQTQLGAGYYVFSSRQDIAIIDNLPNVLISNDTLIIQPIITNMTDKRQTITIQLSGYNFDGHNNLIQTVTIEPHARQTVGFPISVKRLLTHEPTRSRIQLLVTQGNRVIDAIQRDIPLLPHHAVQTKIINGNADALKVTTPSNNGFTEITVSTNPLGSMMHLIRNNEVNIYGCLEQKMSAIIPHLLRHRIKQTFGQEPYFSFSSGENYGPAKLDYNQTMKIQHFMNELGQYQQDDGGFIFWREYPSSSDFRLSALVASFIRQSTTAGFILSGVSQKKLNTFLVQTWKNTYKTGLYGTRSIRYYDDYDDTIIKEVMRIDPQLVKATLPKIITGDRNLIQRLAMNPSQNDTILTLINERLDSSYNNQNPSLGAAKILGYLATNDTLWQKTNTIRTKLLSLVMNDIQKQNHRSTWHITDILLALEPYILRISRDSNKPSAFTVNGVSYELQPSARGRERTLIIPWTKTGEQFDIHFGDMTSLYHVIRMTQYVEPLNLKPLIRGYAIEQTMYDFSELMRRYRKTPPTQQTLTNLKKSLAPLTGTITQGTRVIILTHISNPESDRRHVALDAFIPGGFILHNPTFTTSEKIPHAVCNSLRHNKQSWTYNPCTPRNIAEYHDTKFFAYQETLQAGEYVFFTLATARHPGTFIIKPATVFSFYEPQKRGQTQGQTITIIEKK